MAQRFWPLIVFDVNSRLSEIADPYGAGVPTVVRRDSRKRPAGQYSRCTHFRIMMVLEHALGMIRAIPIDWLRLFSVWQGKQTLAQLKVEGFQRKAPYDWTARR